MAVEVQSSPVSPWAWQDADPVFARGAGPVSPTIRGQMIEEMGSFLRPMQSFRLSGEDEPMELPPAQSPPYVGAAPHYASPVHRSGAAMPPLPAAGAARMEALVQGAFNEMDDALAHQAHVMPSMEEQAWLDQEFEMMEPDTPAGSSEPTAEDEDEAEEVYVQRLIALHPCLSQEEARWLVQQERLARAHANG